MDLLPYLSDTPPLKGRGGMFTPVGPRIAEVSLFVLSNTHISNRPYPPPTPSKGGRNACSIFLKLHRLHMIRLFGFHTLGQISVGL